MKVVQISSEIVPFSKTGGLADVAGSLPKALASLGLEVALITPYYKCIKEQALKTENVPVKLKEGYVICHKMKPQNIPVYFIANDKYFDREELYSLSNGDYKDNCERFSFFCQAAADLLIQLKYEPDIIHCHDWQSALIPVYMKTTHSNYFRKTRSVFTIHNMAYQGLFDQHEMVKTGLDWKHFNWKELEYYGRLNLLKGGLIFADAITTVSPTYSSQIKTQEYGCGMDGVLRERAQSLVGILNGVDYTEWDPATDKNIASNYSLESITGKSKCKRALQTKCGFDVAADRPVAGLIGRLAEQKGIDIIVQAKEELEKFDCQFVILGSGEQRYIDILQKMGRNFSVTIQFNNKFAHEIYAGADMLLMPSRFEPCGLNQIYAMKYGTVPVVHNTGGLADTIVNTTPLSLENHTANGFSFTGHTSSALVNTLTRAILFYQDKSLWKRIVKNCMKQDFSWDKSALKYVELYNRLKTPR